MPISEPSEVAEVQPAPVRGFALAYLDSLPISELGQRHLRRGAHLQAAAAGIAIQLAVGAVIAVVALVFIEDSHSEDEARSTTSTASVS